jgi:hypothetical protein
MAARQGLMDPDERVAGRKISGHRDVFRGRGTIVARHIGNHGRLVDAKVAAIMDEE